MKKILSKERKVGGRSFKFYMNLDFTENIFSIEMYMDNIKYPEATITESGDCSIFLNNISNSEEIFINSMLNKTHAMDGIPEIFKNKINSLGYIA